jgi:hypothetical protein
MPWLIFVIGYLWFFVIAFWVYDLPTVRRRRASCSRSTRSTRACSCSSEVPPGGYRRRRQSELPASIAHPVDDTVADVRTYLGRPTDLVRSFEALRQTLLDARTLLGWLLASDARPVGGGGTTRSPRDSCDYPHGS